MSNTKKLSCYESKKVNNPDIATTILYNNFLYLTKFPELVHTKEEIRRSLTNEDTYCYWLYDDNKLIGYLTGEYKKLNDNRYVYYISYFYISTQYRNKQLGTKLMKVLIDKCEREGTKFILLTCDTKDPKVVHFYKKLGFVQDPILGSNTKRHNVMVLYL